MSTTTVTKLSVAATGAALLVGAICAAPATAITFTFNGNLLTNGDPFAGSATFDANFLKKFAEESFVGNTLQLKSSNPVFDPNGSISLAVQSNDSGNISTSTISSLGLSLDPYVALNGYLATGRGFTTKIPAYTFAMSLPASCINGDFTTCTGSLISDFGPPEALKFPLVPVPLAKGTAGSKDAVTLTASVPEPTEAIALSLGGALIVMHRRKKTSRQCA